MDDPSENNEEQKPSFGRGRRSINAQSVAEDNTGEAEALSLTEDESSLVEDEEQKPSFGRGRRSIRAQAAAEGITGEAEALSLTEDEPSLVEDDGSLPWLETDHEEEEKGVDTGRLIGFGLLALVVLALLLGAVYFFSFRESGSDLVADGSIIEAPAGAMKERPEDAGGKEFPGTGTIAPGVGEGQTTEGRLADDGDEAKPSLDTVTTKPAAVVPEADGASDTEAAATADSQTTSTGGVHVQVGAYASKEGAEQGWKVLVGQTNVLKGVKYRIEKGEADIGTVFRLRAIAADKAAADQLCSALKQDGIACQVK